jgi:plastocyanin
MFRSCCSMKLLILCAASALALAGSASAVTLHSIVKDDAGKPVKDAVVYATAPEGAAPTVQSPREAVMDQENKEFIPYVLPIMVGTSVRFPNKDEVRHHVYSISPAKKFELPLYKGTSAAPVVFDKPGVVVIGCNIHDWMMAYIYVMETPYFAKTGEDGKAELRDIPQTSYEVRVWHPRMKGTPEMTAKHVAVSAQGEVNVDFVITFQISQKPEWKPLRVPSPDGGRY